MNEAIKEDGRKEVSEPWGCRFFKKRMTLSPKSGYFNGSSFCGSLLLWLLPKNLK
jgi:hypothetical protein